LIWIFVPPKKYWDSTATHWDLIYEMNGALKGAQSVVRNPTIVNVVRALIVISRKRFASRVSVEALSEDASQIPAAAS